MPSIVKQQPHDNQQWAREHAKPVGFNSKRDNINRIVAREGFAGGTPTRFIFLSILMNVKCKVFSIKLFTKLKILRNDFNLLCLELPFGTGAKSSSQSDKNSQ